MRTCLFYGFILFLAAASTSPIWSFELIQKYRANKAEAAADRSLRAEKREECKTDPRCASYNHETGEWIWKPGQQPAQVIKL